MKKRGIKTRLLVAFFLVNLAFIANGLALFFMNQYVVSQYTKVVGAMSVTYQLNQSVSDLIDTYNQLVLGNSAPAASANTQLDPIKKRISDQRTYLNQATVDTTSRNSLLGLENSIDQVIREVDLGLDDAAKDKPTAFTHYQAAHRYYDFAQENNTTFTFDQLRYVNSIEGTLNATSSGLQLTAIALLLSVAVGSAVYAIRFASKLITPLQRLTHTATEIAGDNMQAVVDPALLQRPDEIGILATSFNTMFSRLKTKLRELVIEKATAEGERAKDEAILGSIGDAMIVTDKNGMILLVNKGAADMLGIPNDQVQDKSEPEAYPLFDDQNDPLKPDERPLNQALQHGEKKSQVLHYTKPDGRRLFVNVSATPVKQGQDTIGAIELIRDVTKEKEVDRMKTEFISLASHQLRTPLSAIKWFSEMLLAGDAGKLNPEQKEFTNNVVESTQRMIDLVNSLLNISRIESGRIIVDPKPTDLKVLVSEIISDLKGKTGDHKQTLTVEVTSGLGKVNVDPHLIGQVYLNLLTNAIKYTPYGGKIAVKVERDGGNIVSSVTDNGYGIPKEEGDKIFGKFFRASNVVRIETDGTGLGLYLVKSIVESSGGRVWFDSEENKGTTFYFSLPSSGMKPKKGEVTLT